MVKWIEEKLVENRNEGENECSERSMVSKHEISIEGEESNICIALSLVSNFGSCKKHNMSWALSLEIWRK